MGNTNTNTNIVSVCDIKKKLIGLSLDEANTYLATLHYQGNEGMPLYVQGGNSGVNPFIRIIRVDHKGIACEDNFKPNRFDVELENDKIVKVSWG